MGQIIAIQNMLLSGNILLLLLGGMQGLLLCILFLRKKAYQQGYGFLLLYLCVMIAQIVFKILDKLWMMQHINSVYQVSYVLPFLYGPLAWFFARKIKKPQQGFRLRDGLHFVPFFLGLSFLFEIPWHFIAWMRDWSGLVVQLTMLAAYHFYALRSLEQCSQVERMKWVRQFVVHSWWICSVISTLMVLMYQTNPTLAVLRFGFLLLTGFIYWVSYSALQQPGLFFWVENGQNGHSAASRPEKKYANSTLKEQEASRIATALEQLAANGALKDPSLTVEKLADLVHTNRHLLSQVLNERLGQSFFEYINGWRVAEAQRLLRDPAQSHLKIAAIAYDAGFNSLSVFNDVFKKQTGQTPSQFRKLSLEVAS